MKKTKNKANKKKKNIDPDAIKRNQEENYKKIITALDEKFLKSDPSILSEFETENEELKKRIEKLKEEQSSKVAYLKRNVKEVENKIETVQQEYAEYKREFEIEEKRLHETIRQQDVESHRMHIKFAMEIKSWRGKLNQLEEFKRMHKAITQKYLNKEEDMKRMEEKYETDLRTLEEKFTKENDRLKAEIVPKVVQLALDLEKANFTDIPVHIRRILRENYAINVKLDQYIELWQEIKHEMESARKSITSANWDLNESNTQIKMILGQNLILKNVQKKLKKEYDKLKTEFYDEDKERQHCKLVTRILKCVENELHTCAFQKASLFQKIHAHKVTEVQHATDLHAMKVSCNDLEDMFRATNQLFEDFYRELHEGILILEPGESYESHKFDETFIQNLNEIFSSSEIWEEIRSAPIKPQLMIHSWLPPSYNKKENAVYISIFEDEHRPSGIHSPDDDSMSSDTVMTSRFSTVTRVSKLRQTPSRILSIYKLPMSLQVPKMLPSTDGTSMKDMRSAHSKTTDDNDKEQNVSGGTKPVAKESTETISSGQVTNSNPEEHKREQRSPDETDISQNVGSASESKSSVDTLSINISQ